jgi:hypothetical protein
MPRAAPSQDGGQEAMQPVSSIEVGNTGGGLLQNLLRQVIFRSL